MRSSVTKALQRHLLRRHCPAASDALQQQAVQALHAAASQPPNSSSSTSSSSSSRRSNRANCSTPEADCQPLQAATKQCPKQHPPHLPQQQQYHAATTAHHRSAAAAAQPGLQQLLHQQAEPVHQQQARQAAPGAVLSSSSSSGQSNTVALPPTSSVAVSGFAGEDDLFDEVLGLSSLEQQYQTTLQHLHVGHTRNLSQLAQMFDPAAVLAAPDKGAAILEALMFGAAKLGDLALQQQLLRCMDAAGLQLSATGHTALLHSLARSGRPGKALKWLQDSVPPQLLSSNMLRMLVQPLLQQGNVAAAEQALQWAAGRLQKPQLQGDAAGSAAGAGAGPGQQQQQQQQQQLLLRDDWQMLPCMRLAVAAAKGTLGAVQAEWAALQQEQQHLQQPPQRQRHVRSAECHPRSFNVSVWGSYVNALGKVGRKDPATVHSLMQEAVEQLADVYHASAWAGWAQRAAASQQQQQQQQQQVCAAEQQWQLQAQQQASQAWQQQVTQLAELEWQDLNPSAVLPQEVAHAVRVEDRDRLRSALNAAFHLASSQLDEAWMQRLLKLAALLKVSPREWGYDSLLSLRIWQGAPPEAIEELLCELMGWGMAPSVQHFEHLAETYALHREVAAAELVLDRMQAAGHTPLLRTYNRLLSGIAMNGDMAAATRVFARLKTQGLKPDEQTMRALFKCVRLYAGRVRVETARKQALGKPGDTGVAAHLLSQRTGLFLAAYSQLAVWQGEMVAAGLKHTPTSMHHLLAALDRLGYVDDCLQLAKLNEEKKTGVFKAHRTALMVASRSRQVKHASSAVELAGKLAAGEALDRQGYIAMIAGNFWMTRDHKQMLDTVKAMVAAGHEPNEGVLLQMLHVYCTSGMWGEALSVLDDVAAGRMGSISSSSSSTGRAQPQAGYSNRDADVRGELQQVQAAAAAAGAAAAPRRGRTGSGWRRYEEDLTDDDDAFGAGSSSRSNSTDRRQQQEEQLAHDKLWHIVLRKLWLARASDSLLNDFLSRMNPQQLQRFKVLYNLRSLPDGTYSMQPQQDWEVQAAPSDKQQQHEGGGALPVLLAEHAGAEQQQQQQQQA